MHVKFYFSECPEISDPTGGQVEFSNSNMYRSVASFRCYEGYLLDGVQSIECHADEQWSDDVPTCRQIGKLFSLVGWGEDSWDGVLYSFMEEMFGVKFKTSFPP